MKGQLRGRRLNKKALDQVVGLIGNGPYRRDLLIEYLHLIQDEYNCISAEHAVALARCIGLSTTEIYEVATFYHHFDVVKSDADRPPAITVRVCDSITCEMFGAEALINELGSALDHRVRIQRVPCVGRCHGAPVAVVGQNAVEKATLNQVQELVWKRQTTAQICAYICYEDYCASDGYELLKRCVDGEYTPDQIIETLGDSGLRGLGGAGFPAGRKWGILRNQPKPRVLAINIDEGEPGTFKDRYYLERDPHRFLEGMLICAWAIEAKTCFVYIRDEYTACREMLTLEIEKLSLTPPAKLPTIELRRGAGAYICGEESAMIESIEGKRGMPRLRPPYVAEVGVFGNPTLEHNMETLYWVREIIEKGSNWFRSQGRRERNGLRAFSVSGRVNNPGVHLAPAGISVLELIDEYCGGMSAGHSLYAYFPGGASGGILPARLGDIPLDFDTLQPYGCFIGSAAVIILSEQDSVRHAALNAMRFFEHESCGQCTPCRVGTAKAVSLMQQPSWNEKLLEELAQVMEDASICGLGQAAPNPLRCAIKYFKNEFSKNG